MTQDQDNKISTPIQNLVESTQQNSSVGPLVGSVIIILVIILGGLYFLSSLISTKKAEIQTEQELEEQSETILIEETVKQSSSDDVADIETDLEATNVNTVDPKVDELLNQL
jgi:flagellar biogenesis protein FliO